ncbi:MAG: hypothetical protein B6241_00660 [Spirochaetaceae bacterium 4572_59]|nr:MAG: hypothetical protein B6241_00660 [Spirochaetaceae bacterium 4572_59]
MMEESGNCPLCSSRSDHFYHNSKQNRNFYLCPDCSLIFQGRASLPDELEEKARYELHHNSGGDQGYISWLERFISEGMDPWYSGGAVLDFGSGPRPVLTDMLKRKGLDVCSYDKYFSPTWPEGRTFSCILLSEVLEHLVDPLSEFRKIASLSETGAKIILQSAFLQNYDKKCFGSWWYKEDVTHIRFYSASSLQMLGLKSGWNLEYQDGRSLAVFRKP